MTITTTWKAIGTVTPWDHVMAYTPFPITPGAGSGGGAVT